MSDRILIYLIVMLNALCQVMLIWRFKALGAQRWLFIACAGGLPLLTMALMRLLIASGVIHGRLAEQNWLEHLLTQSMSILLLAGPWFVTTAVIMYNKRRKSRCEAI